MGPDAVPATMTRTAAGQGPGRLHAVCRPTPWMRCAVLLVAIAGSPAAAQQPDVSQNVLETAAMQGSAPAQYALGARAEAASNYAAARAWYRRAAENGYPGAQLRLGHMLETDGQAADLAEARDWYRKAAAQGLEIASVQLQALDARTAPAATTERALFATRWPFAVTVVGGVAVLATCVGVVWRRRRRVN